MVKTKDNFDENAFKAWQDECAKRLKPNARPASELPNYLTALYDLEVLNLQDDYIQMFLCHLISYHFGEQLKHNPPRPSANMTDSELENWQCEMDAQREEVRMIPPERFGLRVYGCHVLHTAKNKPLIDADRQHWWKSWGNEHCKNTDNHSESDGYFCYEEVIGEGRGSGFGGVALAREAVLYLGITEEDIKNRTNRFFIYSAALVEEGKLPSLNDLKK
jgi:hypothetical protein